MRLHCPDVRGSEFTAKEGVVAREGLEVAAAERRAVETYWCAPRILSANCGGGVKAVAAGGAGEGQSAQVQKMGGRGLPVGARRMSDCLSTTSVARSSPSSEIMETSKVEARETALGAMAAVVPSTMVPPRIPTGPSVVYPHVVLTCGFLRPLRMEGGEEMVKHLQLRDPEAGYREGAPDIHAGEKERLLLQGERAQLFFYPGVHIGGRHGERGVKELCWGWECGEYRAD